MQLVTADSGVELALARRVNGCQEIVSLTSHCCDMPGQRWADSSGTCAGEVV